MIKTNYKITWKENNKTNVNNFSHRIRALKFYEKLKHEGYHGMSYSEETLFSSKEIQDMLNNLVPNQNK